MYLLTMHASSIGTSEMSSIYKIAFNILKNTYDINSFALWRILGLNNPKIILLFGFKFVKVGIEIGKFIWQNIGVWYNIKFFLPKLLLHLYDIVAKPVFAS